jgi:predicted RND superfamily exporter protein
MAIRGKHIPLVVLALVSLYPLVQFLSGTEQESYLERADALLPAAARDVLLITADFSKYPGDVFTPANLDIVGEIDADLANMAGLRRYSSLLTASVIRAEQDEILVVPFIPEQLLQSYDPAAVEELKSRYEDFPEIRPYLSPDFQTCVFYLEPGLTYPSDALIRQIEELRNRIETLYGIPLEFSGLRAIRVYNERLLTQDLLKMLPIVFLLISLIYFIFFRSLKVLLASWTLKILATTFAYGCFRLFGGRVSPFVILVPIFNFGLLSDYFLHMFYHLRRFDGPDIRARVRQYLTVPLSLTALTSIIGFASLTLLGGEGHMLLAVIVGISILVVYLLVLWWIPSVPRLAEPESKRRKPSARFITRRVHRGLTVVFLAVFKARYALFILCLAATVLGILALPRLKIQPYPLQQFPDSLTIIKAERLLNEKFSGTVPFTLEIDSGQTDSFITKPGLQRLEGAQRILGANPDVGYQNSILTVVKRMHFYFNDADPRYLAIPGVREDERFSALVEQYLLFYSASASPESYESLIDSAHRIVSIQGILKYRGVGSIAGFQSSLAKVREELPPDWEIELSGPLNELVLSQKQLERNWFFAFAAGSLLIFLTVLIFFRNLKMSLISMLPSLFILLLVTGICLLLGIQIDEYTIIIVAVSTGLTIDYTIHLLNSIQGIRERSPAVYEFSSGRQRILRYGYSLIRSGGLPVFLSFLTSVVAFSSLLLSSFAGAAHFGLLISAAISSAFFIGVFLLPLFFIPGGRISTRSQASRSRP